MRVRFLMAVSLLSLSGAGWAARAGDSLYGSVQDVKGPDLVVFVAGDAAFLVRIAGLKVPDDSVLVMQATALVTQLVRGRRARIYIEYQAENGELVSQLVTADSAVGMGRDVGLELVERGLVLSNRRSADPDLIQAEKLARASGRGVWAANREE